MSQSVAFLGLGAMGQGMVQRLLEQGYAVTVWNRSPQAAEKVAGQPHVTVAESVAEAFDRESVIHSMLADDASVLAVFSDELLSHVPSGRVHINHATVSPDAAAALAERHVRHGVGYVQAPVLGRSTIAHTGNLLVVASGEQDSVAAALPSLEALGKQVWNLGPDPRAASVVKLAVNYSILQALQSITESVVLVESAGIDPNTFVEILTHTAFSGSAHKGYGPLIAQKIYEPVGFQMALGKKDLALVRSIADSLGVTLPTAPVLGDLFDEALADSGLAALDWAAVAEVTRRMRTSQP